MRADVPWVRNSFVRKVSECFWRVVLIFFVLSGYSWADDLDAGAVEGMVTDPVGRAVVGAEVRARGDRMGIERRALTKRDGRYRL